MSQDASREYIEVGFNTAAPINFVDIYETYSPGAIDTVYVLNPYTSSYDAVYTATAGSAPDQARKLHVSFPTTPYPVSSIRIAMNSAYVHDWNEIDAVAVGELVPVTYDSYTWSTFETSNQILPSAPGDYSVTVTAGSCTVTSSTYTLTNSHVTIGPSFDWVICSGSPTVLAAGGAASYSWNTGETTSSITVSPTDTSIYVVTGTDINGCVSVDSITVYQYAAIDPGSIVVTK